jgi:medium-chain acyl-[acyl-carrier-protein] hydrolase
MYRTWGTQFPDTVEVIGVQLPGREALIADALQDSIAALVAAVRGSVEPFLDRPFAFFGHSMGAWIAFELTRALRRDGQRMPEHLFASGRRAPQIEASQTLLHKLADEDLVHTVMRLFGGIPDVVRAEPELMALLLPVLRADLKAIETYAYQPDSPLPCPISAFGGLDDHQVSSSDLKAWSEQTQRAFRVRTFPGSHFYLNESSQASLCQAIGRTVLGRFNDG